MRRAAKVDANQEAIVSTLRRCGMSVQVLSEVGKGTPDLLVGWRGINGLLEVKDGDKVPSEQKLTSDQVNWHAKWGGQVAVVRDATEAVEVMTRLWARKIA